MHIQLMEQLHNHFAHSEKDVIILCICHQGAHQISRLCATSICAELATTEVSDLG